MKIPIGRELPFNKNHIINKNLFPKNKYLNILLFNNNYMNNHQNNHINTINIKKNNRLKKIGSEVYNNIKTQENSNMLPLIVSYKRDNSYQSIKPINNANYNFKLNNNKPKLKYIPKYNLKPVKNILKIH